MTTWALRDVTDELSPFITGTAAGDGDVFILGHNDPWVWESPFWNSPTPSGPVRPWSTWPCSVTWRSGWSGPQGLAAIQHI